MIKVRAIGASNTTNSLYLSTLEDLLEKRREYNEVEINATDTEWTRDAFEKDSKALNRAIVLAREGKRIFTSTDDDGDYFFVETDETDEPEFGLVSDGACCEYDLLPGYVFAVSALPFVRKVEAMSGGAVGVCVRLTDKLYDLDDDDEESVISQIVETADVDRKRVLWLDDYESQPTGTCEVTVKIEAE